VDRPGNKLRITIFTSRPGIIIGRKGAEIEKLKGDLAKKTKREVFIDIQEVHKPELDAQLVSESIGLQLEKRVAFRRAMRKAVDSALRFGCKGIKVRVSGRLNGAEIARTEWYLQGQLPLHTCEPISITASAKPTRLTELSESSAGCTRAKSFRAANGAVWGESPSLGARLRVGIAIGIGIVRRSSAASGKNATTVGCRRRDSVRSWGYADAVGDSASHGAAGAADLEAGSEA
jgi:hypothetical protein